MLNLFGDLETFIADDLYSYRYIITPLLVLAVLGAVFAIYRTGGYLFLLRQRLATALIGVPLLAVAIYAGDYLLSPLWERSYLEEDSPLALAWTDTEASEASAETATSAGMDRELAATPTAPAEAVFEPVVVQSGAFVGSDDFHFGNGDALIIQTGPNSYVLRFENFSVRNGPNLYVYLSEDPSGATVDEAQNLGTLKATDGAFNYEIPSEIDVSSVRTAVVWCRQFAVLFAHAELGEPVV